MQSNFFTLKFWIFLTLADRARDTRNNEVVALKKMRMEREKDGLPLSAIREIALLFSCKHENVVAIKEVVVGKSLERLRVQKMPKPKYYQKLIF